MSRIYNRTRRARDRVVRCYLTLDCRCNCHYCSALVPSLAAQRKAAYIEPEIWAEGINRRNRHTLLAGGEPFLYPDLAKLVGMIERSIRIEIYTNLRQPVDGFLDGDMRGLRFLVSLHPGTDVDAWLGRAEALRSAGHSVRCHVIKREGWQERLQDALKLGVKVTLCDDQKQGSKSRSENASIGRVRCQCCCYLYGPSGYRYICVKTLGLGGMFGRYEHISEEDGRDCLSTECELFGYCAPCDNLIEGYVEPIGVANGRSEHV